MVWGFYKQAIVVANPDHRDVEGKETDLKTDESTFASLLPYSDSLKHRCTSPRISNMLK